MKLALKLILVFVFAILAITIAMSYLAARRAYIMAEQRQQEYAKRFVDNLHRDLMKAWDEGGVEKLEALIRDRSRNTDVESRWVWFDEKTNDINNPYAPRAGNQAQKILESEDQMLHIVTRRGNRRELTTYLQLEVGNQRKGGVEFTSSLAEVQQQATETIFQTILMIGLIALLAVGIILLTSVRIVARPLELLTEKTQRVGQGDFSNPVEISGNDELSQLGQSINEMCARLAKQQQEIADEAKHRKETETQLRHADRLKTVGRLAAGIAHEIGTPLGVISGRAALISNSDMDGSKIKQSADTIKSEADRITSTIRQLLDFARPSTPHRDKTDLVILCQNTIDLVSPLMDKTNSTIQLIESPEPTCVYVDQDQIQQVITNLLVNAAQASNDASQITITIATRQSSNPNLIKSNGGTLANFATIAIADDGPGIDRENLKHIFEPFFTTKDVGQGTGLGLSIAYGIVQEHNGWIDVDSQLGQGSCFTVYLPLNDSKSIGASI